MVLGSLYLAPGALSLQFDWFNDEGILRRPTRVASMAAALAHRRSIILPRRRPADMIPTTSFGIPEGDAVARCRMALFHPATASPTHCFRTSKAPCRRWRPR